MKPYVPEPLPLKDLEWRPFRGLIRPANAIRQANLLFTKLRILMRFSHTLAFLPHKQCEYTSRKIDEVGRMLGAWGKAKG